MQHDTQRDQESAVSSWTPVGGAYAEKETIRRCLALEAVLMQMFVHMTCSDPNEPFLELD